LKYRGAIDPQPWSYCHHDNKEVVSEIYRYHNNNLFHKDIKPDNIIVNLNKAFLIDIGLVTSMESGLLLTTHGTEYYRDPEMVRMAIQGQKIKDTDCAKFDIYSVGATLYFMLEGSFPASGSLSRYSKKVPYVLQSITNKAMTDHDKRYGCIEDLLHDLEEVIYLAKSKGWKNVKIADLYSFGGYSSYTFKTPCEEFSSSYRPGMHLPRDNGEAASTFIPTAEASPVAMMGNYAGYSTGFDNTPMQEAPVSQTVHRPARASSFMWGILASIVLLFCTLPFVWFVSASNKFSSTIALQTSSSSDPSRYGHHGAASGIVSTTAPVPVSKRYLRDIPAEVKGMFTEFKQNLREQALNEGRLNWKVDSVPVLVLAGETADTALTAREQALLESCTALFKREGIPIADALSAEDKGALKKLLIEYRSTNEAMAEHKLHPWLRKKYTTTSVPYIIIIGLDPVLPQLAGTERAKVDVFMHYGRTDVGASLPVELQ